MNVRSRIRRRALVALVGSAVSAAGVVAGAAGSPPAGAVGAGWTVSVDAPAAVSTPTVVISGRVGVLLGRPRTVHVRLVPRIELPASCGAGPEAGGPVEGGRYAVELRPTCNGPYRAEVVAAGTDLLGRTITSGSPAGRDVSIADPGPAPAPPSGTRGAEGITVVWPGPSDPDVVGWTLTHDGGESRSLPGSTTRAVVPAGAGDHGFRLVARRWGADGPGGSEVTSPTSDPTVVHVAPVDLAPPGHPGRDQGIAGPGSSGSGAEGTRAGPVGGVVGGASASAEPPRRRGGSGRGGAGPAVGGAGAAAPGDPGYRGQLPYGEREGAAPDEVEPAGEQVAAPAHSVQVSRTSERVGPGLVTPFALAVGLFAAAVWLWSSLRRGRLAVVEEVPGGEVSG